MDELEDRINRIEKDLQLIKRKLRKQVKERKTTLREKFIAHDHMVQLRNRFDYLMASEPFLDKEELKQIVNGLCTLVDRALDVMP